MLYIHNKSNDPYFNMACEEYIFKHVDEDVFMLWQNHNTIVVGKNQNTIEEIEYNYVKDNDISVVRRLSGGGAVYHDMGNVNFTFVTKYNENFFSEFDYFTKPVIDTLDCLGIKAEQQGRNDISIDGRKFSGNSQVVCKGRILHHGTIMIDVNKDILSKALYVKPSKIESKGIKSVRKRVTNINEHLESKVDPLDFIGILSKYIKSYIEDINDYEFSDSDLNHINNLVDSKYKTWEWNYGNSPEYNIRKEISIPAGKLDVILEINNGYIKNAKIFGDFFGIKDVDEIAQKLVGAKHDKKEISELLKSFDISNYVYSINEDNVHILIDGLF